VEKLFKEKKITKAELDWFNAAYFKVDDNGSYYFAEDQLAAARNNAIIKIHKLLELSTSWMGDVFSFNIKAAPGYGGFGNDTLKYPRIYSTYNDAANTQILSPISGALKAGSTETFVVASRDYTRFAIIIDREFHYFDKNSQGNFELTLEIPAGIDRLNVSGLKGNTYWTLIQYVVN
jgi:hypothetical protein